MTNLFRNSSPGAPTLKQAAEQAKKRLIERGRQMRQARELAAQGRGSDTEVAHVARGEYVIPEAMQTPEVRAVLRRAAAAYGVPLEMLSVGNAMNRINPNTGAPEFGVMDWISGLFQDKSQTPDAPPAQINQAPLCRLPDGTLVPYRELPGGYAMVDGGGGGIGQHGLAQEIAKASDANVPKPGGVAGGGPSGPWTSAASTVLRDVTGGAKSPILRQIGAGTASVGGAMAKTLPVFSSAMMLHDYLNYKNPTDCDPFG